MKASRITAHIAGAGLFAGALAWGCHQQLQYVMATLFCTNTTVAQMWIVSGAALFVVAVGGIASWAALRRFAVQKEIETNDALRPRHFMAQVGLMGALTFLFAVALQAVALLFLPVCTG